MNEQEFIDAVARRANVSTDQAATLTRAGLATLAERISGGEADDIANQLPGALGQYLRKPLARANAEPFGLDEFVRRVSERGGVDQAMATAGVHGVLTTIREAVTGDEVKDMLSQLPREFLQVIEPVSAGRRAGT
jgi:uncharacterized protein (DUF2267 family)